MISGTLVSMFGLACLTGFIFFMIYTLNKDLKK